MEDVFDMKPSNDAETAAMESMLENYPKGDIVNVKSFVNSRMDNPTVLPSGIVTMHPFSAVIHPDTITPNMFDNMLICPIIDPKNELTDETFKGFENELLNAIPQYSENPPRVCGICTNGTNDGATWSAELGNGFTGVFKAIGLDGRSTKYFIVTRAGAQLAQQDFKDTLNRSKTTFEQVMQGNNKMYNSAKQIAKRNTRRVAYSTAYALNVQIDAEPDVPAFVSELFIAEPRRATGHMTAMSSLKQSSHDGDNVVAVFHDIVPSSISQRMTMVYAGLYHGIEMFKMDNNGLDIGRPASTGRNLDNALASDSTMQQRCKGVVWEGRMDDHHPELHPNAYGKINGSFLKEMGQLGWRQEGVANRQTLIPVLLKISNFDLKR